MTDLPVVGAAMTLEIFEAHYALMAEKNRDLELQDFHYPSVLDSDLEPLIERAKKALANYGGRYGIHGPFWDLQLATWDPQVRTIAQNRLQKGIEICEMIGATHMVIHSPYTEWDHNNRMNYPGAKAGLFDRFHETLAPIVERAYNSGVVLVLENISDIDPFFRVEIAASFKSEALQISVDTGHAQYAHGSRGAPPVDYYIKAAGDALQHVHLQDADGYADRHWALGEGTIRWHSVFRAINALNSDPRLIIEVFKPDAITKSIDYLRSEDLAQ